MTEMCEYAGCSDEAEAEIIGTKLCRKHFIVVIEWLYDPLREDGRKQMDVEEIIAWAEGMRRISPGDFASEFGRTMPTSRKYLRWLESIGIVKRDGKSLWRCTGGAKSN